VGFAKDHIVYEQAIKCIFARRRLMLGGIGPKPLAHDIGTSVVPVREALIRLSAQDVVEFIPSKGFFVPPLRGRFLQSLFSLAANLCANASDRTLAAKCADNNQLVGHESTVLASHLSGWHERSASTLPLSFSPSDFIEFDRLLIRIAHHSLPECSSCIVESIIRRTVQYRFYLYINLDTYRFEPYTATAAPAACDACLLAHIFREYARLATDLCDRANSQSVQSSYM
jgi:DNA-binding GntR family transcriptional regulator